MSTLLKNKIQQILGDKVTEMSEIGRGASNKVYKIHSASGCFALKVNERGLYDFFPNESEALFQMDGFHAPKLFHYFEGGGEVPRFLLMEYIEGHPASSHASVDLPKLLHVIHRIHEKTKRRIPSPQNFGRYISERLWEKCYGSFPELRAMPSFDIERLEKLGRRLEKHSQLLQFSKPNSSVLIHGDPGNGNILETPNGSTILIDWELAQYTQPEVEYAGIIWTYMEEHFGLEDLIARCPSYNPEVLLALTLARGLDVSVWVAKWKASLRIPSEIEEAEALEAFFWKKVRLLYSML